MMLIETDTRVKPIAIALIKAKRSDELSNKGLEQAKNYAHLIINETERRLFTE